MFLSAANSEAYHDEKGQTTFHKFSFSLLSFKPATRITIIVHTLSDQRGMATLCLDFFLTKATQM